GVIILAVVKIGQNNIVLQAAGDRLQLRRRGEAPADGGVEMSVVPIEGDVCKECQAEGSANNAGVAKARQAATEMERQAQSERENQQHRRAPGAEIEGVGESVVDQVERRRAEAERDEEQRSLKQQPDRPRRHAPPLSVLPARARSRKGRAAPC